MPRPKPPVPTTVKKISVRWSQEDHIAFLQLGGSTWLRKLVQAAKNKGMVKRELAVEAAYGIQESKP